MRSAEHPGTSRFTVRPVEGAFLMLRQDTEIAMKPRISVLTLGVADLEASLEFYRNGLALPTEGIVGREFEHGAVAFFRCRAG
jgi:hypothetical protein